jgi:hypothetical protein
MRCVGLDSFIAGQDWAFSTLAIVKLYGYIYTI